MILVGPGTGIAPFRGFWQHRLTQMQSKIRIGKMWLFFGCRQRELDLYKEEKSLMLTSGVLDRVFLALSREQDIPKVFSFPFFCTSHLFFVDVTDLRAKFDTSRSCRDI